MLGNPRAHLSREVVNLYREAFLSKLHSLGAPCRKLITEVQSETQQQELGSIAQKPEWAWLQGSTHKALQGRMVTGTREHGHQAIIGCECHALGSRHTAL